MSISITGWALVSIVISFLSQAQPTWSFCGDPECFIILCAICRVFELSLKTVYEACVCALWKRLFLIYYTVAYFRAVGVCGQPLSTINSWFILFNFGFIHFIWVTFSVLLHQWMNEVPFIAADHLCVSAVGLTTEGCMWLVLSYVLDILITCVFFYSEAEDRGRPLDLSSFVSW